MGKKPYDEANATVNRAFYALITLNLDLIEKLSPREADDILRSIILLSEYACHLALRLYLSASRKDDA